MAESVGATSLNNLTQGQVIQITPKAGTYMCSDQNCSGNGGAAEPYKLMFTGVTDGDSAYFVMMDNYCAWRSADCTYANNGTIAKSWSGTSFNSNGNNAIYNSDIGGGRQSQHVLIQLENFYNSLPDTIGTIPKATAIPSKTFDMSAINYTSGTGNTTKGPCRTSTNSTPYGNIEATFNGANCTMISKVSLPSYTEWQGGMYARARYPTSGSIGFAFCQIRFGTNCSNNNAYGLFGSSGTQKAPSMPWLRSPSGGETNRAWLVNGSESSRSVSFIYTLHNNGVLPTLWLLSSIYTVSGNGTYAVPYIIDNADPTMTLSSPLDNTYRSSVSGYKDLTIAGTVTDPDDGQSLLVEYKIDNGTWTNLVLSSGAIASPANNTAYTGLVNVESLSEGEHTLQVRVFDGIAYSSVITGHSFYLDHTPPSGYFIINSPIGGVINNQLSFHFSVSDPLSGDFAAVVANPQVPQNSGLPLCEIQASNAPRYLNGTIGDYAPFTTIFAVDHCGTSEATNSAILFADYIAQLEPGQTYRFQLNLIDQAGNATQLALLSSRGLLQSPVISSYQPTIALNNPQQDYLLTPVAFQQVSPGTPNYPANTFFADQVVFNGTITDLDIGDQLTINLRLKDPIDENQMLLSKQATLVSNGGEQAWRISVCFSELEQAVTDSHGTLTPPLSNFEFTAEKGALPALQTATYSGQLTLEYPPNLTSPEFTTNLNPTACPLNGSIYDLCPGALASFSAIISDPDISQPLTFLVTITNPLSQQSLTKQASLGNSPMESQLTPVITFTYAELLALGESLHITYLVDDNMIMTSTADNPLSLYPAASLISSLKPQLDLRFASTIYIKDPSSLFTQGFLKLQDLGQDYQIWTHPLYLYHLSTNSSSPNPYPYPFLVKAITDPQLGILKLKGK